MIPDLAREREAIGVMVTAKVAVVVVQDLAALETSLTATQNLNAHLQVAIGAPLDHLDGARVLPAVVEEHALSKITITVYPNLNARG
jgi:hypothetical protein